MGQYKQWLAYREKGQQLRTELQQLEEKQERLQEKITQLAATTDVRLNPIVQALITAQQSKQQQETTRSEESATRRSRSTWPTKAESSFAGTTEGRHVLAESSPIDYLNKVGENDSLLPTDINAFVDEHTQTDPQIKVPWWLRNKPDPSAQEQNHIDQHSSRTDHSVERFFQRWSTHMPQVSRMQQEADRRKDDSGTQS